MSEDDYINRFVHDKVLNELEAENARLNQEVERLRKAGEWRPIKTAPTGIQILLYSKDFCMIEGSVCDKTDPTDASEELLTLDHNGDDLYGMTHWIPLPKPPQEGADR